MAEAVWAFGLRWEKEEVVCGLSFVHCCYAIMQLFIDASLNPACPGTFSITQFFFRPILRAIYASLSLLSWTHGF